MMVISCRDIQSIGIRYLAIQDYYNTHYTSNTVVTPSIKSMTKEARLLAISKVHWLIKKERR